MRASRCNICRYLAKYTVQSLFMFNPGTIQLVSGYNFLSSVSADIMVLLAVVKLAYLIW